MSDLHKYSDLRITDMMREVMLTRRTYFEELEFWLRPFVTTKETP